MQESGEMYLETMLILEHEKQKYRAIDIVDKMGFSKPSVSRAMSILRDDLCIAVDDGGYIQLTEKGRSIAERIYERHKVLTSLLVNIGVPEGIASQDACKIEHDISDESFDAIKTHINTFLKN